MPRWLSSQWLRSIVLVEGNYVLLDLPPWAALQDVFCDTWFVDADLNVAMARVYERQVWGMRVCD
eukprot:363428-Chlamydomonas_euryale.AAC.13